MSAKKMNRFYLIIVIAFVVLKIPFANVCGKFECPLSLHPTHTIMPLFSKEAILPAI